MDGWRFLSPTTHPCWSPGVRPPLPCRRACSTSWWPVRHRSVGRPCGAPAPMVPVAFCGMRTPAKPGVLATGRASPARVRSCRDPPCARCRLSPSAVGETASGSTGPCDWCLISGRCRTRSVPQAWPAVRLRGMHSLWRAAAWRQGDPCRASSAGALRRPGQGHEGGVWCGLRRSAWANHRVLRRRAQPPGGDVTGWTRQRLGVRRSGSRPLGAGLRQARRVPREACRSCGRVVRPR